MNQYAGPAPVSLSDYVSRVQMQSVTQARVSPADLDRAFHQLVLKPEVGLSLQNENVRFEQSRNVRFHRWPGALWKRSESP
jgi:hypothetical protein